MAFFSSTIRRLSEFLAKPPPNVVDPALEKQLIARGQTRKLSELRQATNSGRVSDIKTSTPRFSEAAVATPPKVRSVVSFLPEATRETFEEFGFIPKKASPTEPLSQLPKGEQVRRIAAEVPGAAFDLTKDIAKSVLGTAVTPFTKKEEVKIPFTDIKLPTLRKTYNETKESHGPLAATLLTSSRAAGDFLVLFGAA